MKWYAIYEYRIHVPDSSLLVTSPAPAQDECIALTDGLRAAEKLQEFTETVNQSLTALTSRVVELEHALFANNHVPVMGAGPDRVFPHQSSNMPLFPSLGLAADSPVLPSNSVDSLPAAPGPEPKVKECSCLRKRG